MNHSLEALTEKEFFIKQLTYIDENHQELNGLYLSSTPISGEQTKFILEACCLHL